MYILFYSAIFLCVTKLLEKKDSKSKISLWIFQIWTNDKKKCLDCVNTTKKMVLDDWYVFCLVQAEGNSILKPKWNLDINVIPPKVRILKAKVVFLMAFAINRLLDNTYLNYWAPCVSMLISLAFFKRSLILLTYCSCWSIFL